MAEKRTDQAFIAGLSPETRAALHARSDQVGLAKLFGHIIAIVVCSLMIASGMPGWWLLLPIQGLLLVFLFSLEHEATHKTPFAGEALNDWVGRICGMVIILPFTWFRYFHLAHHRYTNDPERDPELLAGAKPQGWLAYLAYVSGIPFWFRMIQLFLSLTFGRGMSDFIPERARSRVVVEARWMAVFYGLLGLTLFWSSLLIWLWLVPILIGQPFLRLCLLAEHVRCAFVADMFVNTRTTLTNRFVRWLTWNMPFHAEHHAMPNVPFHKLPELHDMTSTHLLEIETGYGEFHRKFAPDMSGS